MTYTPTVGDLLIRPKIQGWINHTGLTVGFNKVLQNTREKGEHVASIEEFSEGEQVTVQRTGANPSVVQANAQRILANPKPYDPVLRNCEHTVSDAIDGKPRSPQLMKIICIVIGTIVAAILVVVLLRKWR